MSAPLIVSIPHRLGREEAARRLKTGLDARRIQRAGAEGRRGEMGARPHDFPHPRARAGGVRSSRCGGRSCQGGSDLAVAAAEICRSGASGDQESRQSAAGQKELSQCAGYRIATSRNRMSGGSLAKLSSNQISGKINACGKREPTSGRHNIRKAVRPFDPGRPSAFEAGFTRAHAFAPASRSLQTWPSSPRPAGAGTARTGAAPRRACPSPPPSSLSDRGRRQRLPPRGQPRPPCEKAANDFVTATITASRLRRRAKAMTWSRCGPLTSSG